MAGGTTYFSLGSEWENRKLKCGIVNDKEMFDLFNVPELDDVVKSGKEIRFSHEPRAYGDCVLADEWKYLQNKYGYKRLFKEGEFWYAIK